MNKDVTIDISLTTNQIDVILNALEEKKISIEELYNSIYDTAYSQIQLKTNKEAREEK